MTGPGCSSIGGGAFTELGPFYPRSDGRGLSVNKYAWNKGDKQKSKKKEPNNNNPSSFIHSLEIFG